MTDPHTNYIMPCRMTTAKFIRSKRKTTYSFSKNLFSSPTPRLTKNKITLGQPDQPNLRNDHTHTHCIVKVRLPDVFND